MAIAFTSRAAPDTSCHHRATKLHTVHLANTADLDPEYLPVFHLELDEDEYIWNSRVDTRRRAEQRVRDTLPNCERYGQAV